MRGCWRPRAKGNETPAARLPDRAAGARPLESLQCNALVGAFFNAGAALRALVFVDHGDVVYSDRFNGAHLGACAACSAIFGIDFCWHSLLLHKKLPGHTMMAHRALAGALRFAVLHNHKTWIGGNIVNCCGFVNSFFEIFVMFWEGARRPSGPAARMALPRPFAASARPGQGIPPETRKKAARRDSRRYAPRLRPQRPP